jgi:outer membrane cobalamin receptor
MMRWRHLVICLAISAGAACHTAGSPEQGAAPNDIITREQIDSTHATSIYDVVARLHGEYLRDRGSISILTSQHARAVVFLNDQEYGIIETMRNIPPDRVAMIRYYDGPQAVAKFGSQYGGGVIQLVSRFE